MEKQEIDDITILIPETSGERIDRFVSENLEGLSRSYIQKLLKEGHIEAGGRPVKPNYKVTSGEEIKVSIPEPESLDVLPEDIPLDILYEDDDILIVNKPKGMVVHPSPGHYSHTLVNAVLFHCKGRLSSKKSISWFFRKSCIMRSHSCSKLLSLEKMR